MDRHAVAASIEAVGFSQESTEETYLPLIYILIFEPKG